MLTQTEYDLLLPLVQSVGVATVYIAALVKAIVRIIFKEQL